MGGGRGSRRINKKRQIFEGKNPLFFEISNLPILSLCLQHLHSEDKNIFLLSIDVKTKVVQHVESD